MDHAHFEETKTGLGLIDIPVSNTGYLPIMKPLGEGSIHEWLKRMRIDVKGSLILSSAFLPHASSQAVYVHMSTGGCHICPMPANSSYPISKLTAAKLMEHFTSGIQKFERTVFTQELLQPR